MTLKYLRLHKIAMTNWWPTLHHSTISLDFGRLLFDISIGAEVDLDQNIFNCIATHSNGNVRN